MENLFPGTPQGKLMDKYFPTLAPYVHMFTNLYLVYPSRFPLRKYNNYIGEMQIYWKFVEFWYP